MDVLPSGSQMEAARLVAKITRKELFLVMQNENLFKGSISTCNQRLYNYIVNKSKLSKITPTDAKDLKCRIKLSVSKLMSKWKDSHNMQGRFLKKHAVWLEEALFWPKINEETINPENKTAKGRPKKCFAESSLRTKQRNIQTLLHNTSTEKLSYATQSSLVKTGKRTRANVVKLALDASPKSLKKMQCVRKTHVFEKYSPEEALALIMDTSLTKQDYIKIQKGAKSRGANIYPAYNAISKVKKCCYPVNITVTESEASISLQDLLDLTVRRLYQVQEEVILLHLPAEVLQIDVYYKWGLDGSGGHSIYKQNFQNNPKYSDSNIVISTIVPLEMSVMHRGKKLIFWKNLSPSSIKYCRPIRFKLVKENNETVTHEYNLIEEQIQNLNSTIVTLNEEKSIQFKHITICTMMDGKTCNVLTDTASSQTCNICKVTPKDMNDIYKVLARPSNTSALKFGISILHSYLRCFEYLLHIAYKMDLQQWQARGESAKHEVKIMKNHITNQFYEKMGLVVDQPKQGGGNSNDGNTARKFFKNPSITAEITGLDEDIITRFSNILSTISSCHYIKLEIYKPYCSETAKLCVQKYGWYKMSATVHKLFIHSSEIIFSLPLAIGQLSEDVLEASQKEFKNVRLFHSRKTSRVDTNTDILHYMLIGSDPIITSKRRKVIKQTKPYNQEVLSMITVPEFLENSGMQNDDDIDFDDERDPEDPEDMEEPQSQSD